MKHIKPFNSLFILFLSLIPLISAGDGAGMPVPSGKKYFSPNNDGIKDTAVFQLQTNTARENISAWVFEIKDESTATLRSFRGDGAPPERLEWDGKNANQYLVPDGIYNYNFSIITKAGNEVAICAQEVVLDRTYPSAELSASPDLFSPNADGIKDETIISLRSQDANGINSWLLVIEDDNNTVVKSFSALGEVKPVEIWDGRGDYGEDVPDGDYTLLLTVQDNAGNVFKTPRVKIHLDRDPVLSSIDVKTPVFSPNGDGIFDDMEIRITIPENVYIENWALNITNAAGRIIRTYADKGEPYRKIVWDGADENKKTAADGAYNLVLTQTDKAGNTVATVPVTIELDNTLPVCLVTLDNRVFSPNGDGYQETASFSIKALDEHSVDWKLSIKDDVGKPVKTYTGRGKNPVAVLTWDGRDDNKNVIIDGVFRYVFEAVDIVGNRFHPLPGTVQIDRTPPVISAQGLPELFSPNNDGILDTASISMDINDASPLEYWKIDIKNAAGRSVRGFRGNDGGSQAVEWDGKNDDRAPLPDGPYYWTVEAKDISGNSSKTAPKQIVVGATKPELIARPDLEIFSPNSDDIMDSVKFTLEAAAFNKIKNWKLKIVSGDGETRRVFSGLGKPPASVNWAGEKDNKRLLSDGKYSYIFEAGDEAGNRSSTLSADIVIDTTKPELSVAATPAIFSPNADAFRDETSFILNYRDASPCGQWELVIENTKNAVCRKFGANGAAAGGVPASIVWDGRDENGKILEDGIYNYRFSAQDIVGNANATVKQNIKIDNTPPQVAVSARDGLFSPNGDGVKDTTEFYLDYKDASDIDEWSLQITAASGDGAGMKTFKSEGRPSQIVGWDGKNDRELVLPDGEYDVVLCMKDEVGNQGKSEPAKIRIDCSRPLLAVITQEEPVMPLSAPKTLNGQEAKRGLVISLAAELLFDIGQAKLKPEAKETLDKAAYILKKYPLRKVSVEGHTCTLPINTPEFPDNQALSEARAKAVAKYFTDDSKIAAERFTAKGFGETRPIAPNTIEDERRKNRRVEIILLKKGEVPYD